MTMLPNAMRTTGLAALLLAPVGIPCGALANEDSGTQSVQPSDARNSARVDRAPGDPWEGMNRAIFNFNEALDGYVLEPVATGWDWVVPAPVQQSVGNVFDHLALPMHFANDVLQWKFYQAGETAWRAVINSTLGVAGLFDPATHFTVLRSDEDWGQTLGAWGVPAGPYLMLPLLGPSNPRDAAGLVVNSATGVLGWFAPFYISAPAAAVDVVNDRAALLEDIRAERASAFDFYAAVRNASVSFRANQVRDKVETDDAEDEDLYYFDEDE